MACGGGGGGWSGSMGAVAKAGLQSLSGFEIHSITTHPSISVLDTTGFLCQAYKIWFKACFDRCLKIEPASTEGKVQEKTSDCSASTEGKFQEKNGLLCLRPRTP
ncbi:uncharacterized protein [Miscanthus floridulus]|uniref:uncharacterized protein n=1 Tax=Miscanthus floridulus TaxID=154761 RepID=UPI00345866C4